MGTDICQYGNHKINFENRDYNEIACEIKEKLDNLQILNEEHLRFLVIQRLEDYINFWNKTNDEEILEKIKKYKERTKWEWNYYIGKGGISIEDDFCLELDCCVEINFSGFLDFELQFTYSSIYFWDPPYRYKEWFECDKEIRDEWRKYMYQIITLFGGDRVIYLPDQGADHILDKFDQLPVLSFEEIEKEIIKEYGKNERTIGNFRKEDSIWYYIDSFNDLEMNNKLTIDEYKKWYEGK
jgi:hypothetical protein